MDHFEKHHRDNHHDSALDISEGGEAAPSVNPYFKRKHREHLTTEQYVEGVLNADITILPQAITLVESNNPNHYKQAQEIIEQCLPHAGNSIRIGITGVPGAGKSSFIEAIGGMVEGLGHKLAVLAIDPSSELSRGSILGDKTRMATIATNPNIFIRPSPSAGSLGGVARKTRETVVLCEAAGFDVIFIETVGVGQSEIAVHSMVDMFMMLQIAGAGDELQGIKRGIMEMADLIAITKADGDNVKKAELAQRSIKNALMLFPTPESQLRPDVLTCSAYEKSGLEEIWEHVGSYMESTKESGFFHRNRQRQSKYWMHETILGSLQDGFFNNPDIEAVINSYERRVVDEEMTPFVAAKELMDRYIAAITKSEEGKD